MDEGVVLKGKGPKKKRDIYTTEKCDPRSTFKYVA